MGNNATPIWRRDVQVEGSEIKAIDIDFTTGKFSILTTGNGELWDCTVHITKAGDTKSIAQGRTYKSSTRNPMIKELSPGSYDIKIKALSINGNGIEKTFNNVDIIPGETQVYSHNFEFGTISISTLNNNHLWDCTVNTYNVEDKEKRSLASGRTYKSSTSNP
jgi:hypothetical protein